VERAVLYEELRGLDETRHRFISLASHELRTPAAAVYGAAATLRGRARDLAPEVAEELQKTLYEQSARLAGLIPRSAGSSVPGSGLGLAIARSYALAHGGDLIYDSVSPSGARFEPVLPQPEAAKPTSRIARR